MNLLRKKYVYKNEVMIAGYFNVNVLLGGMLSGLSSVGLHQAFKNLIENKEGDK